MQAYADYFAGKLQDHVLSEAEIADLTSKLIPA
jgi:hypothetical protein